MNEPEIRALIVDDEPLGRERIRRLLQAHRRIAVVGECADGIAALDAIESSAPDLVFLDVQMPELDGFELLESLDPAARPVVVFVTAHDAYAIRAFDVHALDYLLKPFDRARFDATVERVMAHFERDDPESIRRRLSSLLDERVSRVGAGIERLVVRSSGRVHFVRIDEIDWLEAASNYVRIHAGEREILHRETLTRLARRLPARFVRIHRSTVVNVERVRETEPIFHGDHVVRLHDGTELTLTRTYREAFLRRLEGAGGR